MADEWCWSANGENYYDAGSGTREDALEYARVEVMDTDDEGGTLWTAKTRVFTIGDFLSWWMLENAVEAACDEVGELAWDWGVQDLKDSPAWDDLLSLMEAWATKHDLQPNFYGVTDVQEHPGDPTPEAP